MATLAPPLPKVNSPPKQKRLSEQKNTMDDANFKEWIRVGVWAVVGIFFLLVGAGIVVAVNYGVKVVENVQRDKAMQEEYRKSDKAYRDLGLTPPKRQGEQFP